MYSEDAEKGVIGSILLRFNECMPIASKWKVRDDTFYFPYTKIIWKAIEALYSNGKPPDLLTVTEYLRNNGEIEKIGGVVALDRITEGVPTHAHMEYYCEIVKQKEQLRSTQAMFMDAANKCEQAKAEPQRILNDVQSKIISHMDSGSYGKASFHKITDYCKDKIAEWRMALGRGYVGIPLPLQRTNSALGGLRPGVVSILAAYRGTGKSTLSRQISYACARDGIPVALFSLEDAGDQASGIIVASTAGFTASDFDVGRASEEKIQLIENHWLKLDIPLYISSDVMSIDHIITSAIEMKAKHNIGLIIIDHLQYISPYQLRGMNRNDTIAMYMERIRSLARRLNIPVLVLSQISNDAERHDRIPGLSDFRDSGAIGNDCRQAMVLYWDAKLNHHVIKILKNNYGRSGDEIGVHRNDELNRFEEI